MPKALSMDIRERIVETYKTTLLSQEEVAARFKVGVATVVRLMAMSRNGSLEPKRRPRGPKRKIHGEILATLKSIVEDQPDLTKAELLEKLTAATGVHSSVSAVGRALQDLGFTRKKKHYRRQKNQASESKNCIGSTLSG